MKRKNVVWICLIMALMLFVCTTEVSAATKIKISGPKYVAKGKTITLKANKKVRWKSSNRRIAKVTAKGKVKGIRSGTVKITARAKNGSGKKTWKVVVKKKAVKSIRIKASATKIYTGGTVTLKAKCSPSSASQEVTWKSSNKSVAKVNSSGKVTGVKAGTVRITATARDGSKKRKSITIKVVNKSIDYGVWKSRMTMPSASEIQQYNSSNPSLPPYIGGWLNTEPLGRFTEYAIDFKADHVPSYTYCCLANFYLDYSSLESKYARVYTDSIGGYAGFQRQNVSNDRNSIMSFWDVFCENSSGRIVKTIRAKLIYPEPNGNESFGGEGTGAHHLTKYSWKTGRWYRMLLQCGVTSAGNTTMEQWVKDLSTGEWTKLCVYDLGVPGVAFRGNIAVFLEGYNEAVAGNVRAMEIRNVRAKRENSTSWTSIRSGLFEQSYDHSGSYNFGTSGDTFWIVTTGVSGKSNNRSQSTLNVTGGESSRPY